MFEFVNESPRFSRDLMVYCDLHWGKLCIVSPRSSNAVNSLAWGSRGTEDMNHYLSKSQILINKSVIIMILTKNS